MEVTPLPLVQRVRTLLWWPTEVPSCWCCDLVARSRHPACVIASVIQDFWQVGLKCRQAVDACSMNTHDVVLGPCSGIGLIIRLSGKDLMQVLVL